MSDLADFLLARYAESRSLRGSRQPWRPDPIDRTGGYHTGRPLLTPKTYMSAGC